MYIELEHILLKKMKTLIEQEQIRLLVGVSAGADSMAGLNVLSQLRSQLQLQISVAHIHHGWCEEEPQLEFRNKAYEFVKTQAMSLDLLFYSNIQELPKNWEKSELKSEKDLREFRHQELQKIMSRQSIDYLVLAHHHEDLLENRLIRMIRGTHIQGLKSMTEKDGSILRPFLEISKVDIENYLKMKKISFLNDPSNESNDPLRNWIRNFWLKELESKHKGSVRNLSLALQTLLSQTPEDLSFFEKGLLKNKTLNLPYYFTLSHEQKFRLLAYFLRENGLFSYTKNHLKELDKRIEGFQSPDEFSLLKNLWSIDGLTLSLKSLSDTHSSK